MTGSAPHLDPRLTPARPDLAAAGLSGLVEAAAFVEGTPWQVQAELADVKREPRADAFVDTQLLHGETVLVFEDREGWSWMQADRDGYVGYVATSALGPPRPATHRVVVNRTFVYPAADMKRPVLGALPLDARVAVEQTSGAFAKLESGGYAVASHLTRLDRPPADFVAVAQQLVGAPYLWGGKSAGGIDCSGLVQLAASVADIAMPRDTDLQERIGRALPVESGLADLARGDLVFWKGHVGIMIDPATLLHANGHHMLVMAEAVRAAQQRIEEMAGLLVSSVRRLRS